MPASAHYRNRSLGPLTIEKARLLPGAAARSDKGRSKS